jgi:hypothetical protein
MRRQNIVRYFAAWLEEEPQDSAAVEATDSSSTFAMSGTVKRSFRDALLPAARPAQLRVGGQLISFQNNATDLALELLWSDTGGAAGGSGDRSMSLFDRSNLFDRSLSSSGSSEKSRRSGKSSSTRASDGDSDSDSDSSNDDRVASPVASLSRPEGRVRRVLYIQMEHCPTTLRRLIDEGQLHANLAECVTLLRQVRFCHGG